MFDGWVGLVFEIGSLYVALIVLDQADFRLKEILMPLPPMRWGIKVFLPLPSDLPGSLSLLLSPFSESLFPGPHLFSTLGQRLLAPTPGAPPPYQPLQRMCCCVLDTHKELFWGHAIQESCPGQGLEHQGCVGKV